MSSTGIQADDRTYPPADAGAVGITSDRLR